MYIADWPGIGNDLDTPKDKAAARLDHDLPEDIERRLGANLPHLRTKMKDAWRNGEVDIVSEEGNLLLRGPTDD